MIRLLVRPDTSAAQVMAAIVAETGLAVSERGVVATGVQVEFCDPCGHAHPLSIVCADTSATPDIAAGGR